MNRNEPSFKSNFSKSKSNEQNPFQNANQSSRSHRVEGFVLKYFVLCVVVACECAVDVNVTVYRILSFCCHAFEKFESWILLCYLTRNSNSLVHFWPFNQSCCFDSLPLSFYPTIHLDTKLYGDIIIYLYEMYRIWFGPYRTRHPNPDICG